MSHEGRTTYREHNIWLPCEANDFKFVATMDEHNTDSFVTMAGAREAIDQVERAAATTVDLQALGEDGRHVKITGLNRANGRFNGLPADASHSIYYYPDHPVIERAVEELRNLRQKAQDLDVKLRDMRLPMGRGHMRPEQHAQQVQALVDKHAAVLASLNTNAGEPS